MTAIKIGGKEFDAGTVQQMIDAGLLGAGQKHDTSASTPSNAPLNGPYPGNSTQFGIFSEPGARPGYWDATPRVRSFARAIPMYRSLVQQELIDIATGVTVGSGNNQTSACAVGPKPGALKAGRISATFGIIHMSTKIFDITQAGMRRNRADIPQERLNRAMVENAWMPQVPGIQGEGSLNSALRAELYALGIELERTTSLVHFTGVAGTEDNTYRGVARQWNGLDSLIKTGYTDSVTGQAIPAADSEVVSFDALADGGSDALGRTIVAALIDTYYGQTDFMSRLGITPGYALVMRPDLFRALAAVWSCTYSTTRCTSSAAGQPLVRDAVSVRAEYEAMLNGNYLPMEGTNVPVLFDDGIARETLGNGHYKSDIYGVALTGNGRPVLYGEYFDMNNPEAQEIAGSFGDAASTTVNNGLYRVFKRVTGGCIEFDFFARPRLISDAPFMNFRLDDVAYKSHFDQRDARVGESYYVNGGRSYNV